MFCVGLLVSVVETIIVKSSSSYWAYIKKIRIGQMNSRAKHPDIYFANVHLLLRTPDNIMWNRCSHRGHANSGRSAALADSKGMQDGGAKLILNPPASPPLQPSHLPATHPLRKPLSNM